MLEASIVSANEILGVHPLAAVRLGAWDADTATATFEVFHLDWPGQIFGVLRFHEVGYLQCPEQTSWGYQLRLSPDASLPSRCTADADERVFELYTADGMEPSAFVAAEGLDVDAAS